MISFILGSLAIVLFFSYSYETIKRRHLESMLKEEKKDKEEMMEKLYGMINIDEYTWVMSDYLKKKITEYKEKKERNKS